MIDFGRIQHEVSEYYGNLPHPLAPEIKTKDYPAFARVAMLLKDALPEPHDVMQAHQNLKGAGISPDQFERSWKIARPLANHLLGRDPEIGELAHLADAHPADVHEYYSSQPHPDYPHVTAGDFVRYMDAATPIARKLTAENQGRSRGPLPVEVARFASAGYSHTDIANHYSGKW